MSTYAVLMGETIVNRIMAESLEDAENLTGSTCVEDPNNSSFIGGSYIDGVFIQPPAPVIENTVEDSVVDSE